MHEKYSAATLSAPWLRPALGLPPWQDMDICDGKLGATALSITGTDALRHLQRSLVTAGAELKGLVINVGAGDACNVGRKTNLSGSVVLDCDPVNEIFFFREELPHLRGIMIEQNEQFAKALSAHLGRNSNVNVVNEAASTATLDALLQDAGVREWRPPARATKRLPTALRKQVQQD